MRPFALAAILVTLSALLAGCTSTAPTARSDLAFPVASSLNGVNATSDGELALSGARGLVVRPAEDNASIEVGLAAAAQTRVFQACAQECLNLTVPLGSVLAEGALIGLNNLSLNAVGPDRDAAIFFYDGGHEGGRWIRWADAAARFQVSGDWQALGNVTSSGFVGTITPLVLQSGQVVTLTTAALEGVEQSVFARGSSALVNGTATIELPLEFQAVAQPGLVTAQVTLTSRGAGLFVTNKTLDRLQVESIDGEGDATFDWFVQAPRRGSDAYSP